MSIISKEEILRRLNSKNDEERLIITPLLESYQVGTTSVDLRLGTWFLIPRKREVATANPQGDDDLSRLRVEETVFVPFGRRFVLHPNQFVLGCTLEYIKLPADLEAWVEGRSSWGRVGLTIATATAVHPGFHGVVTLELRNIGEVPVEIFPCWWIGQVFFHIVDPVPQDVQQSRYAASTRPVSSRLRPDPDFDKIKRLNSGN